MLSLEKKCTGMRSFKLQLAVFSSEVLFYADTSDQRTDEILVFECLVLIKVCEINMNAGIEKMLVGAKATNVNKSNRPGSYVLGAFMPLRKVGTIRA
jgi:hypothetical protein